VIGRALLLAAALLAAAAPARAQHPGLAPPRPAETPAPPAAPPPELDCRGCHIGEHRGIVQMFHGTGGRGVPASPSTMAQARLECIACHVAPKEAPARGSILGQSFRPSDQACVGCHDARYGAMFTRWRESMAAMHGVVAARAAVARRAVEGAAARPGAAEARRLLDDADFNARYVALARGAHNVFYAGALLRRANDWVDRAAALAGAPRPAGDDALVRGGYCAALCHEPLGMKLKETVTFRGRPLPHARHASELGATCTTCHSADAHKKLAATPATCSTCHHSPQNERCESCHREQTAFYRGTTKTPLAPVAPNIMAAAVTCTNCHDFAKPKPRAAIAEACTGCHEPAYLPLLTEWTKGAAADVKAAVGAVAAAERALAAARRAGRRTPEADARLREAREALALVRAGGVPHNPLAANALLERARKAADSALAAAAPAR
jgi:hypothetical protein